MDESITRRFVENPAQAIKLSQVGVLTPVYEEGRVYAVNMGVPFCAFELAEEDRESADAKEYLDMCIEDILNSAEKAREENKFFWHGAKFDYKKRLKAKREKAEKERREAEERAEQKRQQELKAAEEKAKADKIREENRALLYKIGEAREQAEKAILSYWANHPDLDEREKQDAAFLIWLKDAYSENDRITKTGTVARYADWLNRLEVYVNKKNGVVRYARDTHDMSNLTWPLDDWLLLGEVSQMHSAIGSRFAAETIKECQKLEILVPSDVPSWSSTWYYWTFREDLKDKTGIEIADIFRARKADMPIKSFITLQDVSDALKKQRQKQRRNS